MASQAAIDVATEISQQGQLVFDEIKSLTDLSQGRDEKGVLRSITMTEKNRWAFKKCKVLYLLGQLDSLKLSLAVMLQVLQMGKAVALSQCVTRSIYQNLPLTFDRQDPLAHPLTTKATLQDRAEIQNMIVVQHWSLVELRRLFQLAENEAREEALSPMNNDDPPPSYDSHSQRAIEPSYYAQKATEGDLQLSITSSPVKTEDTSRAMVKYQERPVQQLDAAFTRSLVRENQVLGANVDNIVDHLLAEWTQIPELDSQPISRDRRPSLSTYYESDEEDTTESEYEASHTKGRFIEGPRTGARKVKKDVRFRATVDSDSEEDVQHKSHRRPPRKHVLHSEDDTSSDSDVSPVLQRSQPSSRRSSEASNTKNSPGAQDSHDRNPRPYSSGGRAFRSENFNNNAVPSGRPNSRGMPQPPMGPMPTRSMPNVNQWQGSAPMAQPGLRPPPYQGPAGGPPRPSSRGSYGPPSYMGHSPQPAPGMYFPQQQRPQGPPPVSRPRPPRSHRHRTERQKAEEDKHVANKNVKRGLLGGAAIAGIMDLLQGLDGI